MFSTYNWSNSQIIIYEPCDSKDLMYIIKKHSFIRILYNGTKVYAWQADEADHHTARQILSLPDEFIGLTIDKGQIIPSFESIKDSLLHKFVTEFWKS